MLLIQMDSSHNLIFSTVTTKNNQNTITSRALLINIICNFLRFTNMVSTAGVMCVYGTERDRMTVTDGEQRCVRNLFDSSTTLTVAWRD